MTSRIIEAAQGSEAWHQHRASHYGASEAPAMLGIGLHKTRGQLLHEKKTGIVPEVDEATQRRFDKGHEFEAIVRPWAEDMIESELYPVVLADDVNGLPLSASLDGLTIDDSTAWEHKHLNKTLIGALDAGEIPEPYRAQMEQQLMLSSAERCLFMASNGDKETMRYSWYATDAEMRERLVAGWKQFDDDLKTYEPPAAEKSVTGTAPSALPALRIELSGAVTDSNLDEFRDHAIAVFGGIGTDLATDEDFADAEETVKWCRTVEKKLAAAKDHALSQTADIDRLFRTIDEISEQARKKRLELDKLVKSMKDLRKREIFQAAHDNYCSHCSALEQEFSGARWPARMPDVNPDIAGAMKGKRTIATLRDAAETAVANAKIEADQIARGIRASLDVLKAEAEGYETLFPDGGQLAANKSADDLRNLVKARIAEHHAQERQRAERQAEQERQRAEHARHQAEANTQRDQQREAVRAIPKRAPPAAAVTPAPTAAMPERPSDEEIIGAIADYFGATESIARDWIAGMDLISAEA